MSLAKYMQFYRNKGFFSGSIVRVTIPDESYIGSELILSRGSDILQSKVVSSSVVEFFTNVGGMLNVSCDNGQAILSGDIDVSVYGTYEITLDSGNSSSSRQIYPDSTEVIFFSNDTQKTVTFAYTGDIAPTTVTTSDDTVATATINENEITITKADDETEAECNITATVASSANYTSKSTSLRVRRVGQVGSWSDASDETIVQMVELADQGKLHLHDYWHVGDVRRVTIDAITPYDGSYMVSQPQQQIDLILMHDALEDKKYTLVTPTASNRTRASFVVGMKDCLHNLTPIDFISGVKTVTVNFEEGGAHPATYNFEYKNMDIDTWLNEKFFEALPSTLRDIFKNVNIPYNKVEIYTRPQEIPNVSPVSIYNIQGVKAQKVALPSLYEIMGSYGSLYFKDPYTSSSADVLRYNLRYGMSKGGGVTGISASQYYPSNLLSSDYEGSYLDYYHDNTKRSKRYGTSALATYYTRTDIDIAFYNQIWHAGSVSNYRPVLCGTPVIESQERYTQEYNVKSFDKDDYTQTYYGISPILFI